MLYWQVHLMLSNINWVVTSISHILSSFYHITSYIVRQQDPNEPELRQVSFVALLSICHVLYVALSYFSDHQKKRNYCNEVILTKKKENLK